MSQLKAYSLIRYLAQTLEWNPTGDWADVRESRIKALVRLLPSGSGIGDVALDLNKTKIGKRIVISFSYHHMTGDGWYDGYTYHTAVITPDFEGIKLRITGRDRNHITYYLYESFYWALKTEYTYDGLVYRSVEEPFIESSTERGAA